MVYPYPLLGLKEEVIVPIVASVASVAFSGSDSNHLSRIFDAGAVINSRNAGASCPNVCTEKENWDPVLNANFNVK